MIGPPHTKPMTVKVRLAPRPSIPPQSDQTKRPQAVRPIPNTRPNPASSAHGVTSVEPLSPVGGATGLP